MSGILLTTPTAARLPWGWSGPECREEETQHLRVRSVAAVDEDGQRRDQPLRDEVQHRSSEHRRPEQPIANDEPKAGEQARRRFVGGESFPRADEAEDDDEREEERECIDQQHAGRAEPRDQEAREQRPSELCHLRRRLHERRALGDELLVLAEDLRQDETRRRVVGRQEAARRERDREQQGERKVTRPVEDRDQRHQRGADGIRHVHRHLGAELRDH
jgi:hypothetical protein